MEQSRKTGKITATNSLKSGVHPRTLSRLESLLCQRYDFIVKGKRKPSKQ